MDPINVKILQRLGRGRYSEVHKVEWNGKLVAAKQIHSMLFCFDPEVNNVVAANFIKECELLRRLKHPNILRVIHVISKDEKPPTLITELLDCDLEKHFDECETLALEELGYIMLDVAKGLQYLHGQDEPIIHSELCSKNILLNKRNRAKIQAKIAGFGLARIFNSFSPVPTPAYMKPETFPPLPDFQGPVNYSTELDIFSFGMTLLEGISNLSVCTGRDKKATKHSKLEASKIDELNPLKKLVMDCLEHDPKKRPSAEKIVEKLSDPATEKAIVEYDFHLHIEKVRQDFIQWIPVRRRTIRELEEMNLDEMAKDLDELHRNANLATAFGASTSVVGTGLVVGGFIGSFFTFGATVPLMIAGGAAGAVGGLTTFGVKMRETSVTGTNIKKVEDCIAEDKEESEHLRKSFEKLDNFIERIAKRIIDNNANTREPTVEFSVNDFLQCFEETTGMKVMETDQLHPIKGSTRAAGAILSATSSGVTAGTAGARIGTAVFDTLSVASRVTHVAGFVASVLTLPIDAYFLVNSVSELSNNSPSEVAEKIRDIKSKMVCPEDNEISSLIQAYAISKLKDFAKHNYIGD